MSGILALFPGQGSQKVGMGKDLFETHSIAKELFTRAETALGFPISEYCFSGPEEKLTLTEIAQPAILTVSVISYEIAKNSITQPVVAAAGHSLGEYSALVASGAIKFEDAVLLVHKRGKYMQAAVPVGTGKMVAVLGKEVAEINDALAKINSGVAEIANINAPGQIVVAGSVEGIAKFSEVMAGTKMIELPVSAPFHCSLMKPAEEKLREDLAKITFNKPSFPVYANFSAAPVNDPEEIRESLAKQVCGTVRWVESMNKAIAEHNPSEAVEFGYGAVLSGLLKRIKPDLARRNALA